MIELKDTELRKKIVLNLGCGNQMYGTDRADIVWTETANMVFDFNKKFPLKSNYYDEVYSNSVLEHIKNLDNFIREIKRVLKKGGKLFIRTDNASYLPFLFKNHQDYISYDWDWNPTDKHYYLFKEEHLRNLFSEFKDLKISYSCPSKKLFFLPKKFKCMHIELRCEK